jgi:hypothetical protein
MHFSARRAWRRIRIDYIGRAWLFGVAAIAAAMLVPTARAFASVRCPGDLNGDRLVRIDELVAIAGAAVGVGSETALLLADLDGNKRVTIDEVVAAVRTAQRGCPSSHFPLYGPGPHWIADVESGLLTFDATATVGLDLSGDGVADTMVEVNGTTTVFRSVSTAANPAEPDKRNHLGLEIVAMMLETSNIRFHAGDGRANLAEDGPLFSIGTSDELTDSPELSRDVFAVRFEVEIGALVLHNREPLMVEAIIDRLPPIGNEFRFDGPPLTLYNDAGIATTVQVTSVRYVAVDPDAE